MMQVLVFTQGPIAGKRFEIKGVEISIGRRKTNDVVLEDPLVSRVHAIVMARAGVVLVEDLGSNNGTYVNGERVLYLRQLHHGDSLQVGSSRAVFEDASAGQDDTTMIEPGAGPLGPQSFTERQLQVLRLVARGLANKEIARRLSVSERTVKAYLSSVFDKLGVNNRSAAITTALRLGLIDLPGGEEDDAGSRS